MTSAYALNAGNGHGVGEGLAVHGEVAETAPAAPTAEPGAVSSLRVSDASAVSATSH